jgi:hypothetical protein
LHNEAPPRITNATHPSPSTLQSEAQAAALLTSASVRSKSTFARFFLVCGKSKLNTAPAGQSSIGAKVVVVVVVVVPLVVVVLTVVVVEDTVVVVVLLTLVVVLETEVVVVGDVVPVVVSVVVVVVDGPFVFGRNLQVSTGQRENAREECHWSHAWQRFKQRSTGV